MLKYSLYGSIAAGLQGSFFISGCSKKQPAAKPSIILISVDTLRNDHLHCNGYPKETSPNIDLFAQDSLVFENCYSHAPETIMSFASIMSGFLPHESKVEKAKKLPPQMTTIAEILKSNGYKTAAVVSNFILRKVLGFNQGFMLYDDTMNDYEVVRKWPERIAKNTTDRSIEILRKIYKEKFFMWIHYQDPHGPYTPPDHQETLFRDSNQKPKTINVNQGLSGRGGIPSYQYLGSTNDMYDYIARYNGEIRYTDSHLARLFKTLKELGLYDNALIIFTSDHGEGMGEHDYYFAHGDYLYNHQLHVPLILKYGNTLKGRISNYVQHIDIVPTILNIAGIKPELPYRGFDLIKQQKKTRIILSEMKSPYVEDRYKYSVLINGQKMIYTLLNKRFELFDLVSDPKEKKDLIHMAKHQKLYKNLKKQMFRLTNEDILNLQITERPLRISEEEKKKLKSLGYVN
jgi:arylsulfatase A-like enzyme